MAKKTRRQKQRTAARRPSLAPAQPVATRTLPAAPALATRTAPVETDAAAADREGPPAHMGPAAAESEEVSTRRRVGRIVPGAASGAGTARQPRQPVQRARYGSAAAMVEPLEGDDPAIPFDRVPYVPADLRRVALMALLMVILILIAWFVVANTVSP